MAALDELNTVVKKEIFPKYVEDLLYKGSPFWAYMRRNLVETFKGGALMQQPFLYGRQPGGAYAKGGSFSMAKPQVLEATQFQPRYYYSSVTEYEEEIDVEAKGPDAVASLADVHAENAVRSLNEQLAIALWRHGQASGTGIADDRILHMDGISEALNDGVTSSWDGNVFATYGGKTRNSAQLGTTLNSIPYFCGDASGAAGSITYNILTEQAFGATRANEPPDLGIVNKAGMAYMMEKVQVQQVYRQEVDPVWGFESIRLNHQRFIVDDYAPSLVFGENTPNGNYLTSTFTSSASPAASSNLPASTTVTVGEVFVFINSRKWMLRLPDSDAFLFGFRGYLPVINQSIVTGQYRVMAQLICRAPWSGKVIYGFTS
jgi:hypothetical protein